jgi:peptidoglycan/LPS O-acetylase OafA/YrhL
LKLVQQAPLVECYATRFLLAAPPALYARAPHPTPAARLAPWSLAATVAVCAVAMIAGIPDRPTARALLLLASVLLAPYVAASVARVSDAGDKRLGDLAYPLYVIHMPAGMLVSAVALPGGSYARVAVAAAAAWALLRAVDIPLERRRQRFVCRAMRAAGGRSGGAA